MAHAVTIDFHDTLFQCDEWFELEVRGLPAKFLHWKGRQPGGTSLVFDPHEVARSYRELRLGAIESGIEIDSIECVVRVCRDLGINVDHAEVADGVDVLMREVLPSACPRPGAVGLVNSLREMGIRVGLISNAIHHPYLEWALERHDMLGAFDLVLSSARAGYYKSRVELYELAASELGVSPEQTVHIGDSYRFDVAGAARAGMRTVWLNLNGDIAGEPAPDLTVRSLEGLAPLLIDAFHLTSAAPGVTRAL